MYDFKQLQAEAKESRPPHLDHATYVGPVEIRQTESKGRGLFVTQDVKAGDLLLCEKAFSHGHVDEDPGAGPGREGSSKIKLLMNPETGEAVFGAQADLITCIVQKLYHNPSVAPAFIALYHGAYKGVSTAMIDAQPVVDTQVPLLNEAIIDGILTIFAYLGSSWSESSLSTPSAVQSPA